ncbi:protein of unknown function (plasmid) [Azospirillum baldaniorum]|uniref:Uncharacterized protein n=1 Tax=Azospirillum baldaniorum TaxID=1064539 RepID=A0A9P1NN85_9PROT|nr:protein of unknown function [Azospirillum baldaniorum]
MGATRVMPVRALSVSERPRGVLTGGTKPRLPLPDSWNSPPRSATRWTARSTASPCPI